MKKVTVRMRKYDLIRRAVEEGAAYASHRFFKHLDCNEPMETIDRDALAAAFEEAVMNEVCEVINFDEET